VNVTVDSRLTPRDVWKLTALLVMGHRLTPTLLLAGPVLFAVGTATASLRLVQLGAAVSWLLMLVPLYAALTATYAAYRPGAAEVFAPATWTFTDDGIVIEQADRNARATWTEFERWRSVSGFYLLHTTARRYVIVSGAGLTGADRTTLEALLTDHLGAARR